MKCSFLHVNGGELGFDEYFNDVITEMSEITCFCLGTLSIVCIKCFWCCCSINVFKVASTYSISQSYHRAHPLNPNYCTHAHILPFSPLFLKIVSLSTEKIIEVIKHYFVFKEVSVLENCFSICCVKRQQPKL